MNINQYKDIVQKTLEDYFRECREKSAYETTICVAMSSTVLLPGKKLRAVFCLETARALSGKWEHALAAACAIVMLLAQCLIHVDLPCLDND